MTNNNNDNDNPSTIEMSDEEIQKWMKMAIDQGPWGCLRMVKAIILQMLVLCNSVDTPSLKMLLEKIGNELLLELPEAALRFSRSEKGAPTNGN